MLQYLLPIKNYIVNLHHRQMKATVRLFLVY